MNEIDRTRRRLLLGAAVTPIALAACGGGKGETSAGEAAPAASTPAAPPATTTPVAPPATTTPAPTPPEPPPATSTPVAAVAGKYRFQQPLLFQRAHQKWLPMKYTNSRGELVVLPSLDFHFGGYAATGTSGAMKAGSTPEVLCWLSKWRWRNTGGDWLDASLVSQGTPGQGHLANVPAPTAAQKAMLLPHRNITPEGTRLQGAAWRSSAVGDSIRVVSGTELQARGLPVLAPGLGAFEMTYHGCRIGNGQAGANSLTTGGPLADGTAGNDLEMYFKPEHLGRVIDGYMRMYVMLGEGWEPKDSDMQWVWLDPKAGENAGKYPEEAGYTPQTVPWRVQDWTGKFPGGIQQVTSGGIPVPGYKYPTRLDPNGNADTTPVVLSAGGGYSNSSGLYGYQGRWMFSQGFYKENFQGPARDGAILGIELYDFGNQSAATSSAIPSQAHISSWDFNWQSYAGHRGGMGFLYTRRWYCVEMRWKMNSVKLPYAEPAPGTHYLESGFEVDGHIEWWIDGVKCAQTPAFAHRSSRMLDWMYQVARGVPFDTDPASPARLRPVTNVPPEVYMGATSAVLQTYYGGRAANPRDKKVLINGVVVTSGRYIGPMAGVSRDNGGLG